MNFALSDIIIDINDRLKRSHGNLKSDGLILIGMID